jgi:hypothetical protein
VNSRCRAETVRDRSVVLEAVRIRTMLKASTLIRTRTCAEDRPSRGELDPQTLWADCRKQSR